MPLINGEVKLELPWSKSCTISEISRIAAVAANPNANLLARHRVSRRITAAVFQIDNAKLYLPFVTLFLNVKIKYLENIKREKNNSMEQIRNNSTTKKQKSYLI